MPILDMTLSNPKILAFFEGTSSLKPIGEFLYVHTHPKVRNFMSEIEGLINATALVIQDNTIHTHVAHRLLYLAEQYSSHISDVSESSAGHMLDVLKEIYQICVNTTQNQKTEVQQTVEHSPVLETSVKKPRTRRGTKKAGQ